MDHIIYRDYAANRRSFIYCSLASCWRIKVEPHKGASNVDQYQYQYRGCGCVSLDKISRRTGDLAGPVYVYCVITVFFSLYSHPGHFRICRDNLFPCVPGL